MVSRHRLAPAIGAATSLVALVVTGCGAARSSTAASTATPNQTATAAPETVIVPAIRTITLDNFVANYIFPTAHGFVLYGTPGTVGQLIGQVGAPALYYYDNAAQTVQQVAVPTPSADGVARGIRGVITAGDWAIYYVGDATESHWEVWALNLATKQRRLVGSAASEHSLLGFYDSMVTDGTSVVWLHAMPSGNPVQHVLSVYDLASGSSRTLETTPADTSDVPRAMANGTFVLERLQSAGATTTDSLWLWTLGDAAPRQISTNAGLTFTMNDRDIVWDDVHARSLTLYDRATGKETAYWVLNCIRPAMAPDRPYLVCVDFDASTYRLVHVTTGADATFFDHQASTQVIAIGNDRAYWVATPQHSSYSNQIDYFDLPAS